MQCPAGDSVSTYPMSYEIPTLNFRYFADPRWGGAESLEYCPRYAHKIR